jgi:hypothetical protein
MSRPTDHPDALPQAERDRLLAAFDFVRRTGAKSVQLRWSDDEQPVVWMMVAEYHVDANGRPARDGGEVRHEVDASLDPVRACLRLCERLADGGQCTHCGRPAGLDPDSLDTMPLNELVCWYQYDPELKTFRRGCE